MRTYSVLLGVLLFVFVQIKCEAIDFEAESPIVSSKLGTAKGTWQTSNYGRKFAAFEGIPYAKPPLGNLRFKEPQPVEPWMGTWEAVKLYKCIQSSLAANGIVSGEEDCLYLNIYVPETGKNEMLDVLVHIHGGGFYTGYTTEFINPQYLMDRNWIVVAMNYRLGALGFLSTEDETVLGNNGLKDQVLALKWIQDNIRSFGGNPDSVTITGFSAGAASVHFHYFSQLSKGLFHRGISHSGSALGPWAISENPLNKAKKLAKALGCSVHDNLAMIECLKQRPASLIVNVTDSVMYVAESLPFCPFAPVIEKRSTKAFLTDHPYKKLREGNVLDVPWIASHTTEEGILVQPFADRFHPVKNDYLLQYIAHVHDTIPEGKEGEVLTKIKEHFFPTGISDNAIPNRIIKLFTDRMVKVYNMQAAELQSKVTKSPIYYYVFSYDGVNGLKDIFGSKKGVCHGDDMVYFHGGMISKPLTQKEIKLQNICMDLMYSYAKNGNPSNSNINWNPLTNAFVYLNFISADEIKLETTSEFPEREFWSGLGLLENEYFYTSRDEL